MGFKEFFIRRIFTMIIVVISAIVFNFVIFRLPIFIYGLDPADIVIPPEAPQTIKIALRRLWNLPPKNAGWCAWMSYFTTYIYNLLTFKFGKSYMSPTRDVVDLLAGALPYTLTLMVPMALLSYWIGIKIGLSLGKQIGSLRDLGIVGISLFLYALPSFWVALLLILVLSVNLGLFPPGLPFDATPYADPLLYAINVAWHFTLPITALFLVSYGYYTLLTRNMLATVLSEDYILTARAKGLDEKVIIQKHALRNAILPVITVIILSISGIWGGAVITETIFSLPGVGRLFFNSIIQYDYPVAEALLYFSALATVIATFIIDIVYALLDPRIKY